MTMGEAQVYDLRYQRYDGPREGRGRSRRAVFESGVRTVLGVGRGGRAKILPALLFISAMAPAVVFVVILSFVDNVAGDAASGFIPGAGDYYNFVGRVLILFAAVMAPELLIPDRRENILPLYFVRPLTPVDYLSMRFLAFFVITLALVYSGQVVLQAGLILTSSAPLDYIRDNWTDGPRILLVGAAIALFTSIAPLAVAAFTTRRAYAAAFIIAAWLLLGAAADIPLSFEDNGVPDQVALIHAGRVTDNINDMVFDRTMGGPSGEAVGRLHAAWPIASYVLWTGIPALLLWSRYRRLRL